jgi:hypothetical protein
MIICNIFVIPSNKILMKIIGFLKCDTTSQHCGGIRCMRLRIQSYGHMHTSQAKLHLIYTT